MCLKYTDEPAPGNVNSWKVNHLNVRIKDLNGIN